MRILINCVFLFASLFSFGQNCFYKLYSGNGFDKGEGIVQLEDSTYVITGSSSSWTESSQAFLLHLDTAGNYISSQHYGGAESEEGKRVLYNHDLGYYIAGFSNSFSGGDFDAYLTRVDLQGNQLWQKTYGTDNWERINDAVFAKDSSIIMVGESKSVNGQGSDIFMIRTDRNGEVIWSKTFGSIGDDVANSIIRVQDSLLFVAGNYFVADSNLTKGFVMRINLLGDSIWMRIAGNKHGNYNINDLAHREDRIFTVGTSYSTESNQDEYAGSYDFNGGLMFQNTISDSPGESDNTLYDQALYVLTGDKVAIANRTINSGTFQDDYDVTIGYYDSNYQYWMGQATTIMNEKLDKANDMITTSDGGYICVGFNTSLGNSQFTENGGCNIFVMKVKPTGSFYPNTQNIFTYNQLVGIQEEESIIKFSVYPNPFQNNISIHLNESTSYEATIIDLLGNVIEKIEIKNDSFLDLNHLKDGTYFIQINNKILPIIKLN